MYVVDGGLPNPATILTRVDLYTNEPAAVEQIQRPTFGYPQTPRLSNGRSGEVELYRACRFLISHEKGFKVR